jgi:hypothetical protein
MGLKASVGSANGLVGKQVAPPDLGYLAGLLLVPKGDEIATDTLALTESTWLDNINKNDNIRYIMLPLAFDLDNQPEDDVYNTSSIGNVAFVRPGKLTVKYIVEVSPFVMSQLNTFNGNEWDIFKITSNSYITGTSVDGVKFQPFTLQNFRVEGETPAGGDTQNLVNISFTHADPSEWNARPSFQNPLVDGVDTVWNPLNLKDPKAITVKEVTSPAITGFTIKLEGYDRVAHEGAVSGDFGVWDTSGALVGGITAAPTATVGEYDVTVTLSASTTYTAGLLPVGDSTTQGFNTLVADRADVVVP